MNTMSKTESEAARAVRGIVDAICAGVRWPVCFDVALAAIKREDAERAIAWDGITDDTDAIKAATDDGPGYWTPPPGVEVPKWAGAVAWSRRGVALLYEGTEKPKRDEDDDDLWNPDRRAEFAGSAANDPAMSGQWRLIRREPEPTADEVARLREELQDTREELEHVLADWNALVAAIGAPTHGGAAGYAARLREELAEVRALAWGQAEQAELWNGDRDYWLDILRKRDEKAMRLEARLARIAQEAKL